MGKACRICDRKFFLRGKFEVCASRSRHFAEQAQATELELLYVQDEIEDLKKQKDEVDGWIDKQMKNYDKAEEGYKEKLEKIQLEQDHESEII